MGDWIADIGRRIRDWLDEVGEALVPRPEPVPVPVPVRNDRPHHGTRR